jgi:hypothetical protein
MPQQSLQEILHDDNLRKYFGLPDDYDESQAEDLMNLPDGAIESANAMLAFRDYLIDNAPSPSPEVEPHLKKAPVTPPSDDDEDSWGPWTGHEEPPVTKRKQSSPVPGQDYPNGRPPGMPAMMPPGKGKDKGKPVGKNAKDKAKDRRDRSREEKGNGKGQKGKTAKTRVLLETEKSLVQKIAEARAELELEERKKRNREVRFQKQDEERSSSSGNQNEKNYVRNGRKRAMDEKLTGDIPPILTSAGRASILIIIHIVGLCLTV